MKMRNLAATLIIVSLFSSITLAQSTWDNIYTILNTSCTSVVGGCHEQGSSNPSFNVEAPQDSLYDQLINGTPTNPWAKDSSNNKLIVPFSPQTSYMMRKLAHCDTSTHSTLLLTQPFEGANMPDGGNRLPDAELELIYTWIVAGAPETGNVDPDSVVGDICDINVGIRILPAADISFTAHPNPASGFFTCSYTLEHPALVTLELLDVTGKNVQTLFSESQSSGQQIKTIVPEASQGIYFIKLTVGNTAQYMKKIALK